MKRIVFVCLLVLSLFAGAAFAEEMTGVITCEKCKHTDAKAMGCAKGCIKGGVAAIFYDPADQKFYKVANQDAVKAHAGERVVVTGSVSGDTLTVDSIKAAPAAK
jgi:hypothetical protein